MATNKEKEDLYYVQYKVDGTDTDYRFELCKNGKVAYEFATHIILDKIYLRMDFLDPKFMKNMLALAESGDYEFVFDAWAEANMSDVYLAPVNAIKRTESKAKLKQTALILKENIEDIR